jgi:hypothetical protein
MNRLSDLFEQFSLIEIDTILRRTTFVGIALGIVAVVVAGVLGHVLIGAGACIGLALGLLNIRLVTLFVARAGAREEGKLRRVIAGNTLLRLGATTAILFVLVFTARQLGFGALGGVAVFYFVFLANVMRILFQQVAA